MLAFNPPSMQLNVLKITAICMYFSITAFQNNTEHHKVPQIKMKYYFVANFQLSDIMYLYAVA
jgi:hypothetical protein